MNPAKRLCRKERDTKIYKGKPLLAFGNLQQAVPVLPRRRVDLWVIAYLTVPIRIIACSTVSEDGPMEVVLGAPLGGIPLQISA